jgi:hypothetical protein
VGPVAKALADALPLVILGTAMVYFDRLFSFVDDEATTLSGAAQPVHTILRSLFAGGGQARPPLYDLLLHVWLIVSRGAIPLLRAPSIAFFLLGIWMLSRAARSLGEDSSGDALLWMAVFWPYGFHYGRLAGWYSFAFLLISALTWTYLRFQASPSRGRWAIVCAVALALIYTTFAGWALLALLGFDDWLRDHAQGRAAITRLLGTAALLAALFAPLWRVVPRLPTMFIVFRGWKFVGLNAGYNGYALVVSESVAPWFWRLGVPATLAVAVSLLVVILSLRGEARRLLLFAAVLFVAMDLAGILQAQRLLLLAPWVLLPTAVALGTLKDSHRRVGLALTLAIAAGIGWYGVYSKHYYSAQRFLEPWAGISAEAAVAVHDGAFIISNKPAFFFPLTYALQVPRTPSPWRFSGSLPDDVQHPQVWSSSKWEASGQPTRPYVLWVRGMSSENAASMDAAGQWLDQHCGARVVRYLVRDTGTEWKARLFPGNNEPWRIEIRQYACEAGAEIPPASGGTVSPKPGNPR